MAVDKEAVVDLDHKLQARMVRAIETIKTQYPQLFDYYKVKGRQGELKCDKKTGIPKFKTKELRGMLTELRNQHNLAIPVTEKTQEVSASVDVWRDVLPDHPLIKAWSGMAETGKMLQFVKNVRGGDIIRSSYRTLVSTGRTSCTKPNIQNMPREPEFREMFVPRPGYKFAVLDYSVIELRTLASVCLRRIGRSRLAEVISEGIDPHMYTAAMMMNLSVGEFAQLPPDIKKFKRQAAKAINFGVPGGLGAKRLAVYAHANYGVELTVDQAATFRNKLIQEVYQN
jgi:DNA polymerase I-like protein with 3'-5' exonuclease and polymerase domains